MTHYEVLGVSRAASDAEIRKAYLALARANHPDLQADPARRRAADDRMRRINGAWAVLGTPARRRAYDDELRRDERASRPAGAPSPDFVPLVDDDTDYAALLDDTPINGTRVPRWLQVLPAFFLGLALLAGAAGLVASFGPLLALAAASLVLGVLAFLAAPAVAVMSSYQHERR